ncbi:serine/threonine-protein kinase, partial [Streptomyces sp. UNOB3_S3]|uniref:serine/threonine-protein kinase n=1 Tax=Streptomyces sp. UNOB3_S3 TaxID=2871682 RepID=UPI001E43CAA0
MNGQSGARERLLADRYLLVERLGHGPTGVVWRARDQAADRDVAVKELTVTGLPPEERLALYSRMEEGIRAAARLRHPGIVTVLDLLAHDGRPWIVMELIDGRSLAGTLAAQGTLPPRDAARLGLPVLAALGEAHGHGVLHRGVKAANVLLGHGGRVALTDFGITALEGAADLVRTAEALGAPDHLAPERTVGRAPGPESDVWSTGITLYAAVEGISPFRRATTEATLQAVATDPLPRPEHAGPLAPVLEAMLCKDPARRADVGQARWMLGEVTSVPAGRQGGVTAPTAPMASVPARPAPTATAAPVRAAPVRAAPVPTAPAGGGGPGTDGGGRPPPVPPRPRKPRARVLIAAASVAVALVGGGISVAKMLSGSHQPARPPAATQNAAPTPAPP